MIYFMKTETGFNCSTFVSLANKEGSERMKYKRALTESMKLKMLSKVCVLFCVGNPVLYSCNEFSILLNLN